MSEPHRQIALYKPPDVGSQREALAHERDKAFRVLSDLVCASHPNRPTIWQRHDHAGVYEKGSSSAPLVGRVAGQTDDCILLAVTERLGATYLDEMRFIAL